MASKKIQAQMQIDVSFIGNTTKLVKDLEKSFKQLNLSSTLTKQIEADLNKGFKDTFANLGKMAEGLSKPGLSAKQYTAFFDSINNKVEESTKIFGTLKKRITDAFNSEENKKALKDIEKYKKQLTELNKLASTQKGATTRSETAIRKMREETGIDYNISKRTLSSIASRKADKKDLTKNQQEWMAANGLDENGLRRVLELLKQINSQRKVIEDANTKAKGISGQTTVNSGITAATKGLNTASATGMSQDVFKDNIAVLEKYASKANSASDASRILAENFGSELPRAAAQAERTAAGMQTLNEVMSQFGIVLSAGTIVRAFKDIATEAFNFYKSLDSALNEIYVVSNLSIGAVNNLKTSFISMAKDTGMALDDITRSATLFYQQGLSTKEVMEMTEVTSQFAKVAGIDATDAADKLTAAVNGYCLAAEDAALVADKFNKVAAASAADINELSTAFSKAAAQANQAGVSMDNYLAYIATMVEATREAPENIGTSLKTIMSRMQQVKEGGTTEDGETDVNQVETALKSVGIQLRNTEGELRNLEDVFDELGPKWASLDRNTQAYLGTIIAGTRQQSRFITLMQNWDRVLELSEDSANSAGQQALMHAKAMESIESKLQQFQVAWQEFISNLTSSDFIKGAVELLTKLVDAINDGSAPVVLLGTAIGLLVKNITKLDGPFGRLIEKFGNGFKKLKSLNSGTIKLAANYIKNQKSVKQYTAAISKSEGEISKLEDSNSKLIGRMKEIQAATGLTSDELLGLADNGQKADQEFISLNDQVQQNNSTMSQHKQTIVDSRNAMGQLVPTLKEEEEAFNNVTDSLTNITIGLAGLGAILPGALGSIVSAGAGMTQAFSAAVQGIKLFSTTSIASIKAMSAAEKASVILTLISIGVQAIMGVITAVKALGEAFGNQDKNIAESVESMTDALEKYNNAATTARAAKNLIKDYEALANKVYLTATEQEKLNDIAQELGDSLDIEVIEDQFGNLSISMQDAADKMEALNKKAKEAREELINTEHEQIEKYDHNGNVDKFYEEYLTTSRSDIRTAMGDIETGIDTRDLATSATNVNNIMTNLKNAVIDNSAEMSEAFGGLGIEWSLTEDVESMMNAFNNADIDSSKWNDLYRTFDTLQEQIDNMSYDEALEVVEGAIASWGEAAGLTTQQVQAMQDAIMNTLYGSSNLHKTMSGYQDIIDRDSGESQEKSIEDYKKQLEELETESTTFWNPFKQDDAEKEYEAVQKKIRLLEEEQLAYENVALLNEQINQGLTVGYDIYGNTVDLQTERNRLMEEYNISSAEEVENAKKMKEILGQFSDNSAALFDEVGLFDEDALGLLENLQDSGALEQVLANFGVGDKEGTKALTDSLVHIINTTDDDELKEAAQDKLNKVFKTIEISGTMSWKDLGKTLDSASEDLRKMNSIMEEFNDAGGLSLDTFTDLCDVLDSMDLSAIFDTGKMDQYIAALDQLKLGFDESTGTITANGEALKSLQDIQQAATQAKLQQTAQSLEADRAALQAQIYGVEAEMAANNLLIQHLRDSGQTRVNIDEIAQQGQINYNNTMQQAASQTAGLYQDMTAQSSAWATAAITNAASVGDAIKKAMAGELGTANLSAYLGDLVSQMDYKSTGSYAQLDVLKDKDGMVDVDAAIAALESYNSKGQNTINELYSKMKAIDSMQGLLNSMSTADLSKLGTSGSGDSKDVEKYIGQLKEIYNILNRIQVLEHRLGTLDSYADIAQGEEYGRLLRERLDYNGQLVDQYEFLVSEQKAFTNGYKDFIGSVEGLEGVFDFDQFGQIIINWDKYNALQDEAIEGEVSLKEKADDVYDTYTSMFEELHGYFDELIDYYSTMIELQEEMVDSYIEMQNNAADAVREIYQKILDTRLEAIDQEKEALEELREARDRARKDQDNAKAISNLQTNIQRTMMDSSGASDISFIKAQQDMNDKLEEIADDKYSEMLDNIIQRLEQEQDALQENFDELFSNLEWLFSWLDEDIMGDESALFELLQQTDEWQQTSEIEKKKTLDDWKTKFETYSEAIAHDEKGIYGIYDNITNTRNKIGDLEKTLQSSVSKASSEIATTIANWQGKASSSGSSGGSGGSSSGGKSGTTNYSTTNDYKATITGKDETLTDTTKKKEDNTPKSAFNVGDKVRSNSGWGLKSWTQKDGKFTQNGDDFVMLGLKYKIKKKQYDKSRGAWFYYLNTLPDAWFSGQQLKYKEGGMAYHTGPAWLDGTASKPEAVLNALQTEHFIKFTNALDHMYGNGNISNPSSTVSIDTISFNVESMSSPEDGEAAFNMFVNKFKEIGSQSGIKIDSFKNRL